MYEVYKHLKVSKEIIFSLKFQKKKKLILNHMNTSMLLIVSVVGLNY